MSGAPGEGDMASAHSDRVITGRSDVRAPRIEPTRSTTCTIPARHPLDSFRHSAYDRPHDTPFAGRCSARWDGGQDGRCRSAARNKVALVTGAARGLGRVYAETFLRHGATESLWPTCCPRSRGLPMPCNMRGSPAESTRLDVRRDEEWAALVSDVRATSRSYRRAGQQRGDRPNRKHL